MSLLVAKSASWGSCHPHAAGPADVGEGRGNGVSEAVGDRPACARRKTS